PTLPPITFIQGSDASKPEGMDIDVVRALAQRWHASLSLITMDFTGLFPSLAAQRCGLVISGIIQLADREKNFDAVAYQETALTVVARARGGGGAGGGGGGGGGVGGGGGGGG
ncbi:MAG: transporter substrate-binding domain-containing protein, partial [Acetobacter orientalis]